MSDEQRYDEEAKDLPLPDADAAWQKMSALLDKDDRRRPLLPLWFWRYGAVALLATSMAIGGWWLSGEKENGKGLAPKKEALPAEQSPDGGASTSTTENVAKPSENQSTVSSERGSDEDATGTRKGVEKPALTSPTPSGSSPHNGGKISSARTATTTVPPSPPEKGKPTAEATQPDPKTKMAPVVGEPSDKQKMTAIAKASKRKHKVIRQGLTVSVDSPVQNKISKPTEGKAPAGLDNGPGSKGNDRPTADVPLHKKPDKKEPFANDSTTIVDAQLNTFDSTDEKAVATIDSTHRKDTAALPAPAIGEQKTKKAKASPRIVWSAGVGLQQAIALHNRPSATPNSGGRKRAFFDYFPSVYGKAQRGRWALQAEFHYGVPQPTSNLSFTQQTTRYAYGAVATETERLYLRKLYYHQMPVSINYQLLPQFSVGLGGVYNVFRGAAVEREVDGKDAFGSDIVLNRQHENIKGYRDSFFYKTTAGLLVQTDYHWKRLSLGLRYTQNLQPFIKYIQPNGTVADKKNNALQAVLRFRLWKSG